MQEKDTQHRKLSRRLKQTQARIELAAAREQERLLSLQTRKKVLLGALLMAWMDRQPEVRQQVARELPDFLTRQIDRDVFGLPPTQRPPADSNTVTSGSTERVAARRV
jgi:hypothetical protein